MNAIEVAAILSRWVHILSVVIAVGGAFFVRWVLLPAASTALNDEQHKSLRANVMGRWKRVLHPCVALIIVTGGYNFFVALQDGVKAMPYHPIFLVKFLAAIAVFFFAIALSGSSPGFASLRANPVKWLNVQIGLAIFVILLSGVLKTLHQAALTASQTSG